MVQSPARHMYAKVRPYERGQHHVYALKDTKHQIDGRASVPEVLAQWLS
ncbi:hypothetical protein FVEN_g12992 [Fusarium venenatum]|nr:hypothetical protein FVEN_g12992 [Fusarium venenatum]